MIVSVVNTKGGVGKSTLGFNLAVARALAGGWGGAAVAAAGVAHEVLSGVDAGI